MVLILLMALFMEALSVYAAPDITIEETSAVDESESLLELPKDSETVEETETEETSEEKTAEEETAEEKTSEEEISEEETSAEEAGTEASGEEFVEETESSEEKLLLYDLPAVSYQVHMQDYGWLQTVSGGETAGKPGTGKRVEALKLSVSGISGVGISYEVYCDGDGWKASADGEIGGTVGRAKRLEAVKIKLTGSNAARYHVFYKVYIQNYGWLDWAQNGEIAGAAHSCARNIEAVQVLVQPAGQTAPGSTNVPYLSTLTDNVADHKNTHINTGNEKEDLIAVAQTQIGYKVDSQGRTKYGAWYGESIHADAVYFSKASWCAMFISWCADQAGIPESSFRYHSYTPTMRQWYINQGRWFDKGAYTPARGDLIFFKYATNNNPVNHVGLVTGVSNGYVETIEGNVADSVVRGKYSLSSSAIVGYGVPGYSSVSAPANVSVKYQAHVQDIGWQSWVSDGRLSGTTGQAKRMEGLKLSLEAASSIGGGIEYRAHVQDIGWQSWASDGALTGTTGQSKRMEAVQIRLTGNVAEQYDIYYRAHIQDYGWLGWAKNGQPAGSAGLSRRMEGLEIRLVQKGGATPGTVKNSYVGK